MDDVPDSDGFRRHLKSIRNAACSWVELSANLTFDVFKGFDTEKDLVDYFLEKAYFDNVTVFASKWQIIVRTLNSFRRREGEWVRAGGRAHRDI